MSANSKVGAAEEKRELLQQELDTYKEDMAEVTARADENDSASADVETAVEEKKKAEEAKKPAAEGTLGPNSWTGRTEERAEKGSRRKQKL